MILEHLIHHAILFCVTIRFRLRLVIKKVGMPKAGPAAAERQQLIQKMKSTKLGIIAAIALGGLMACGPIALAQDKPATPPASGDNSTPPPRGPRGRGNPMQGILNKLDLTADQKEKVKPIVEDQGKQMRALFQDNSLSQEDRQAKRKSIMDATDAKLKDILTPDQFTKYQDMRKQMMGRRGQRGPGAGGPPAGSTPPKSDSQ
ncbi:MAG TPA: hypothetical protein VG754_04725 [Verrucomicrobiae bacterium]|nr:hypothetical protein [Verrucomicrobiae bacterium]